MNKNKSRILSEKKPNKDVANITKLLTAGSLLIGALTELMRVVLPFLAQ